MTDQIKIEFRILNPPAGGPEKFHDRLRREEWFQRKRKILLAFSFASAALAFCFLLPLLFNGISTDHGDGDTLGSLEASGNPALFRLGLAAEKSEAVTIPPSERNRIAVLKVAVANPDVIYYRIDALDNADTIE